MFAFNYPDGRMCSNTAVSLSGMSNVLAAAAEAAATAGTMADRPMAAIADPYKLISIEKYIPACIEVIIHSVRA